MPITATGLVSGIDYNSIISQIQAIEQKPIQQLQARQTGYQNQISALLSLSTNLATFGAVATSVNNPANFNTLTADVTKNPSGVSLLTATADSTATPASSYALTVLQLAQASKKASQGFVDQNTTAVASGDGTLKFKVGGSGTEYSVRVSSSTTLQGLRDAINSTGGSITASIVNDGSGSNPYRLVLTSKTSGATNGITITHNDTSLDFTNKKVEAAYASTTNSFSGTVSSNAGNNYTGTTNKSFLVKIVGGGAAGVANYKYSIDGGITYLGANGAAYNGSNAITTQGALTNYIDSAVASNATNEGVQIAFGAGTLAADDTFTVDVFNPNFQTAQDAVVKIDNITITKQSNTITDAIQGVTLKLAQVDTSNSVTLNVSSDSAALTEKIKNFVSAYNDAYKAINTQLTFDPAATHAQPLLADPSVRAAQSLLRNIVTGSIPGLTSGISNLSQIGITSDSQTGVLSIDGSKLSSAIVSNPDGVKRLFLAIGTASNSAVSFVGVGPKTSPGTYGIAISVAPQKAVLGGASDANFQDLSSTGLTNAEQLSFTFSKDYTSSAPTTIGFSVTLAAGSKINDIVSALNSTFASKGVGLSASNDSGRLKLTSNDYGKDIHFTVVSDQAGTTQTGIAIGDGSGPAQSSVRSFNGTSDYIDVTSFNGFSSGQNMTLAAWVKPSAVDSTQNVIIQGGRGGAEDGFFRLEVDPTNKYRTQFGAGSVDGAWGTEANSISSTTAAQANTWQFVVATYDGSTARLYVNGTLEASGSYSRTTAVPTGVTIGKFNGGSGYEFPGNVASVEIYNRALSGSEINQIKTSPSSVTSGLVGYWPLAGASPEPDSSGNNNNGTVNGTTVANISGLSGRTAQGVDIAGTINGHSATGKANVLTSNSGFAEDGLSISTESTTTGLFGTIAVTRGIGDRLVNSLDAYTNPVTGIFFAKTKSLQGSIDSISKNITQINDSITREADRLRAQFANLESLLGQFQATSNFLTSALANLPGAAPTSTTTANTLKF